MLGFLSRKSANDCHLSDGELQTIFFFPLLLVSFTVQKSYMQRHRRRRSHSVAEEAGSRLHQNQNQKQFIARNVYTNEDFFLA